MKLWQRLTDLFDNNVAQEMSKRYKDTILCIVAHGKKYYGTYRGVDENGFHLFYDKEKQKIILADDTEHDVLIPRLEVGCYNTPQGVVHVSPNPARQWKRGLSHGNTTVVSLVNMLGGMIQQNVFNSTIYDVLEEDRQQEVSLSAGLAAVDTYGSYAINRNFAIILDPVEDTDTYLMFYQCFAAAKIEGKKITILNDVFRQEFLDNQRKLFPDYEVI